VGIIEEGKKAYASSFKKEEKKNRQGRKPTCRIKEQGNGGVRKRGRKACEGEMGPRGNLLTTLN